MSVVVLKKLKAVKEAAKEVRSAETARKDQVLLRAAQLLLEKQKDLLAANEKDLIGLRSGKNKGKKAARGKSSSAFADRLLLNPQRILHMVESLKQVAALPDPVGEQTEARVLSNGLHLRRVRSPLGVIFMIFESRPNVAIEAFSLAFKAGNAVILRGGKESKHTVTVLYSILREALREAKFSESALWGISDPNRKIPQFLLKQRQLIDVVVPRGGEGLIDFVVTHSEIPIIKNDRGLCHIYIHEDADFEMAKAIVVNAKTQRPGVCNAMETLLVHENIAGGFLPLLHEAMTEKNVQWFCDSPSLRALKGRKLVKKAKSSNWDTEYLDYKINCRIVSSVEEAIEHIEHHGSRHSESIVTSSHEAARKFQNEVDAAAVYWNASTRFTDGFEMGLGGELGVSTQKLHVRGPVGLRELTILRWIIDGTGQIRT